MTKVSLIIPIWNEEKNIDLLVEAISNSRIIELGVDEVVFVENGSVDTSLDLLRKQEVNFPWLHILQLEINKGYGGGILEGIKESKNDFICYIPGDLQILPEAVEQALGFLRFYGDESRRFLIKGNRTTRDDNEQSRFISSVFSRIVNRWLGLNVKDVNGLPKLFDKRMIFDTESKFESNFVFDTQVLLLATISGYEVKEFPVHFYARREGVSSWSKKRIQTYIHILWQLVKLRVRYFGLKMFI